MGHTDTTHLPVAVDATRSGLQILAGLAKDASTARMVNVIGVKNPKTLMQLLQQKAWTQSLIG